MKIRATRSAAASLAALLLVGIPGAAQGAPSAEAGEGQGLPVAISGVPISSAPEEASAPVISREEVLALVKKYFNFSEGPGWLELELRRSGPTPVWRLTYWVSDGRGGSGHGIGEVDATTGRILYVDLRDSRLRGFKKGPLGEPKSVEEARNRAWELVQALYPDKADSLQPDGKSAIAVPFGYWDTYTFVWNEHHNGIPVGSGTVMVSLDRYTLDCVFLQYDLRTNLVFPEGEAVITAEDALSVFRDAARPVLTYQVGYPSGSSLSGPESGVKLVYDMEIPVMLDAITGEFRNQLGLAVPWEEPKEVPAGAAPPKLAGLPVTRENAEAFSREVLELPADSEDWELSLRDEFDADSPMLELYWRSSEGQAAVVLDRETGRVLRARRNLRRFSSFEATSEPTPQEREAAEQEAIRVVQQLYGDLASDLKLEPQDLGSQLSGRLTFRFQRYVNGIRLASNGVEVTVHYPTGAWTDIDFVWTGEVEVPAPEGIISQEEVLEAYFRDRVPELAYYPKDGLASYSLEAWEPVELNLVYHLREPEGTFGFYGIDPYTGEPLKRSMNESAVNSQLVGHWAEGELHFLLERGLITEDALNPDRPVTREEALNMLIGVFQEFKGLWSGRGVEIPYTDVPAGSRLAQSVRDALVSGILRPEGALPVFGRDEEIRRTEFALWLVRALDLDRLAQSDLKLEPGFVDAAQLTAEERNAAALLEALGIIPVGGEFRGAEPVTVAEAAAAVVRMVEYLSETR